MHPRNLVLLLACAACPGDDKTTQTEPTDTSGPSSSGGATGDTPTSTDGASSDGAASSETSSTTMAASICDDGIPGALQCVGL